MRKFFFLFTFLLSFVAWSQTKVSGIVVDENQDPVAFANVFFKDTTEGTITNEDGRFYLESENTYSVLVVSFIGYQNAEIELSKKVNYDMEVLLTQGEQLDEVIVYVGKQSKKNNPAIDILKKIWARKKFNGLKTYRQYQYDKYEKIEFDLNTIDSALMKSKMFKGMEFV
ncbi:MAG: carboxypeptidase-like regulatory domain-containing protein, partial [Bacteroidia bacterium]|nr:carboxypeptidase-like regulatory domain-containing protein [Bacteroidia bacterium]